LAIAIAIERPCEGVEPAAADGIEAGVFIQAAQNGRLAAEGFRRSRLYVDGWLRHADPTTGLIPRNLTSDRDLWNPQDSAADNYPFMVLTCALTDRALFEGRMLDMLATETRLTSRIDRLPDAYRFSTSSFARETIDLNAIIFGASEYVKDGLLPLTEWLGPSSWSRRMFGIVDDIWKHAMVETPFGRIPSTNVEINGEMLQVLSRLYWMSGRPEYLEWATRLGDYYLLGQQHPTRDMRVLRLRDHGCEILSGLCELYATMHFVNQGKKHAYRKPLHQMLDRILEVGRNEHGLFYNQIDPVAGKPTPGGEGIADTWGYTLNGFYTVYLLDGIEAYRDATLQALHTLWENYRSFRWEGDSADGYADSIESALNLYNREQVESCAKWIDSEIKVMWSKQRDDGVIEGWHGDGNFTRTTIMYVLWKTQGLTLQPWRHDLQIGAVGHGTSLFVSLRSAQNWSGKLLFDQKRHKTAFHLPLDYPRINQFPEWFTVEDHKRYKVHDLGRRKIRTYSGKQLASGLQIEARAGGECNFIVGEVSPAN
jgi:hypothetical protein